MDWLRHVAPAPHPAALPDFGPGDQVRVWYRIIEQDHIRQAPFEGVVTRRRGSGISETFTVRRITHGEGVERIFPIHAPVLERVEVLRRGRVHRARLYFLRAKIGKTRIASRAEVQTTAPAAASPSQGTESEAAGAKPAEAEAAVTKPVESDVPTA